MSTSIQGETINNSGSANIIK